MKGWSREQWWAEWSLARDPREVRVPAPCEIGATWFCTWLHCCFYYFFLFCQTHLHARSFWLHQWFPFIFKEFLSHHDLWFSPLYPADSMLSSVLTKLQLHVTKLMRVKIQYISRCPFGTSSNNMNKVLVTKRWMRQATLFDFIKTNFKIQTRMRQATLFWFHKKNFKSKPDRAQYVPCALGHTFRNSQYPDSPIVLQSPPIN